MKEKILVISAIFFIFSSNLCAKSKDNSKVKQNTDSMYSEEYDMSLFEIDRLIRKTEYGEALRQLNIYIENNPENFDNAQRRIKRIMNIRKQYSILAEKLINIIVTDPGNDKEIYEITAQLERFERNPSDENLKFIADLKKSAEFNYFRSKYNDVMTNSAKLTQEGKYSDAIAYVQNEGFWLYQEDFYQKWENNENLTQQVDRVINHVESQVALFNERNFNTRLTRAVNEYITALNNDKYDDALKAFTNVDSVFSEYSRIRNALFKDAEQLSKIFDEIKVIDQDTTDASYLPFMFRFIYGIESVPDSGIVGAIDGQWKALIARMNQAAYNDVLKYYNVYKDIVLNTNKDVTDKISQVSNPYKLIVNYGKLEQRTIGLYGYLASNSDRSVKNPYQEYIVRTDYAATLALGTTELYQKNSRLDAIKWSVDSDLQQIKTEAEDSRKETLAKTLFDSCSAIDSVLGAKNPRLLKNIEWAQNYNSLVQNSGTEFAELENHYTGQLDYIFDYSTQILDGAWNQLTAYFNKCADDLVKQVTDYNKVAERYSKGFLTKLNNSVQKQMINDVNYALNYQFSDEKTDSSTIQLRFNYPDIAIAVVEHTQKQADRNIQKINLYEENINKNYTAHPQWQSYESITQCVTDSNAYLEAQKSKLKTLKNSGSRIAEEARTKLTQAQLARNEGDMRFSEAETALKRENFSQARRKLQDAVTKYEEALSVANDENLRLQWDKKLQELSEKINRTENEIIVKEVRQLKNQARDAYFNGRFDDAEKYLNQAKIRWSVTNSQEDEEITSLMNFVNTAISMQTGREILPSAPQYPEMSQLINIANQYFDSGAAKYKAGNKTEGDKDLEKALESIQKVQYVYPLNQEASLLTLRINQIKDPQKFNEEFAQKIQTARALCKNTNTVQEGYANLLDYYKLNPNYKGLKDLIYQVEIDIGIRQKPVDNSAQTKSKNLYNDAQKAYNNAGNNIVKLQSALDTANKALSLNPNNVQAQELKDKIITKMGGTSVQPTMEDESLYNQAIQYLQNNNVIAANQILQQLMKKPQNQYVQKFKDLKAKIDARM